MKYLYLFICIFIQVFVLVALKIQLIELSKVEFLKAVFFCFFWCVALLLRTFFWIKVLQKIDLSIAYSVTSIVPLLVIISGHFFLNEILSTGNIIGALFIFCGLILIAVGRRENTEVA